MDLNNFNNLTVTVTKIKDTRFKGKHPNNINEGYVAKGYAYLLDNDRLMIQHPKFPFNAIMTSKVIMIEHKMNYSIVHTENSIYKIEI